VLYKVKAQYSFDSSTTVDDVRTAIARANDVLEAQVSVRESSSSSVSRRLADQQVAAGESRRLAATSYDALITTPDVEEASQVQQTAGELAVLASALASVVPEAPPPAIDVLPTVSVEVETELESESSTPVLPPSPTQLTTELSEALSQMVVADVQGTTVESCNAGVCQEDSTATLELAEKVSATPKDYVEVTTFGADGCSGESLTRSIHQSGTCVNGFRYSCNNGKAVRRVYTDSSCGTEEESAKS